MVVKLHLLSSSSYCIEVDVWSVLRVTHSGGCYMDCYVTLTAVRRGPAAAEASSVACLLPLTGLARKETQLGSEHGLHYQVPLRMTSAPVDGVPSKTLQKNHTYRHAYRHTYVQTHEANRTESGLRGRGRARCCMCRRGWLRLQEWFIQHGGSFVTVAAAPKTRNRRHHFATAPHV